jgi:cytidylate kinase
MNIAIDGPAGAGKSTVAKLLAEKLEFIYIDTGAMYRALTWKAIKENVDVNHEKELHQLLKECDITLVNESGRSHVKLNGQDVTDEIRNASVTNTVSYVAKHPLIRKEMVSKQQLLAANGGTVMDGRDIGTAVLPEANVKIFLTASVEERAKRRHEENVAKGMPSDFVKLKEDIAKRDQIDSERDVAPLKQAEDAIVLDSTSMSIEEVVDNIFSVIVERDGTVEH